MKKILILTLLFSGFINAQVFPGAKGYGADWTFPEATAEYFNVTNLNDTGTGSLRDMVSKANTGGFTARIITFYGLSGTITLSSSLDITRNNTYIAGQTSENGIWIKSASNVDIALMRTNSNVNGVIVRGLTLAHGGGRTNSVNGDNVTFLSGQNIIFDRCSFRWSIDENLNAWGSGNIRITVQNTIISESLMFATHSYSSDPTNPNYQTPHSMGTLFGNGSRDISLYNIIYAHNNQRTPLIVATSTTAGNFEIVNVINYNWGAFGAFLNGSTVRLNANMINTWYINGQNSSSIRYPIHVLNDVKLYVRNNINVKRTSTAQTEWLAVGIGTSPFNLNAPTTYQQLTPHSFNLQNEPTIAVSALLDTLAAKVGALPRSDHDTRIINNLYNSTGGFIDNPSEVGGYPTIAPSSGTIIDSDNDGIPNSAEGTYTTLFDYVNSLIDEEGETPPTFIALTTFGITETSATIPVGGTFQFSRFHTPSNATNSSDTWTSSNPSVATVSGAGLVTGVSGGTVTITRLSLDTTNDPVLSDTATVTVTAESIPVTSVSIDQSDMYLLENQIQLSATILPVNASNTNITWSTDDNEIGSVNSTGLLRFGKKAGEIRVGVLTENGNFSDEITIKFFPKRKARLRIVN